MFERLFNEQRPFLLNFARRLTHDDDKAEDLVQNTALVALIHFPECREIDRFRSWCTRILHNLHRDSFKIKMNLERQLIEEEWNVPITPEFEARIATEDALDCLLSDTSPAIRHVMSGGSYEEAAQIACVPIGTIRSRIHAFRKRANAQESYCELMSA